MPHSCQPIRVLLACLLLLSFGLQGCGPVEIKADIQEITVDVEEFVYRPYKPKVYLQPKDHPDRELTALFFPFRMQVSLQDARHYGREIGRVFWQVWLSEQVFPVMEYYDKRPWPGGSAAVAQGRAMGADLVVGGDVTQFLAGGDLGDSQVALRLEIYDVHTGALIWSMAHAGVMKNRGTQDYILFRKRSAMPNDPIYAIVHELAWDLTKPVLRWLEPVRGKGPCKDCPKPDAL